MEPLITSSSRVSRILIMIWFIMFIGSYSPCLSSSSPSLHPMYINSTAMHQNHTAISEFRLLNRRKLGQCLSTSPFLQINVSSNSRRLLDEQYLTVTVTGILKPSENDWVAMISPSHSRYVLNKRKINYFNSLFFLIRVL